MKLPAEKLPAITEAKFQQQVVDFAHLHSWKVAHFRRARTKTGWVTPVAADGKGWPDLCLCKPGRLIFAELKVGRNRCSPEQTAWLDALEAAGMRTYVWTPDNWNMIEYVLSH